MSNTQGIGWSLRPLLLGSAGLIAGAAVLSAAATQYVAYRVGYHPAIGAPLFGHVYAPWRWIEWQQAAWAADARHTFQRHCQVNRLWWLGARRAKLPA